MRVGCGAARKRTIPSLARAIAAVLCFGAVLMSYGGGASAAQQAMGSSTSENPSPGCRAAAATPGESTLMFSSGGTSGTYIEDVPSPRTDKAAPVVIDLHGYLDTASLQNSVSGMGSYGQHHGFVTITPQISESGESRWAYGPESTDITYLGNLLTHVEGSLCVDERRVFVTGLSMGSFTTSAIACEMAGRIAAVAPVSGLQAFPWCKPARAVPVVAFQGTADPFVSYSGGWASEGLKLPAPSDPSITIAQELKTDPTSSDNLQPESIPTQVATWAKRNGCGPKPTSNRIAFDVTRTTYPCATDRSVVLYVIADGGHTWPGGPPILPASIVGRTTQSISADQIIWSFFEAHPLKGHLVQTTT